MQELFNIEPQWLIIMGINFFLIIILFFMNVSSHSKIKKLKQKYDRFMNGVNEGNLETVLGDCLNKVNFVVDKNKELEYQINTIERNMYYCVQKVGIVRYNGFDNVGSDLSFSIAMLDNNDDGIILSSLYSRDSSSTYAKPITGSKSRYALSAEEIKALDIAKKTRISGKYKD